MRQEVDDSSFFVAPVKSGNDFAPECKSRCNYDRGFAILQKMLQTGHSLPNLHMDLLKSPARGLIFCRTLQKLQF
jgi:hypothetical protein